MDTSRTPKMFLTIGYFQWHSERGQGGASLGPSVLLNSNTKLKKVNFHHFFSITGSNIILGHHLGKQIFLWGAPNSFLSRAPNCRATPLDIFYLFFIFISSYSELHDYNDVEYLSKIWISFILYSIQIIQTRRHF